MGAHQASPLAVPSPLAVLGTSTNRGPTPNLRDGTPPKAGPIARSPRGGRKTAPDLATRYPPVDLNDTEALLQRAGTPDVMYFSPGVLVPEIETPKNLIETPGGSRWNEGGTSFVA